MSSVPKKADKLNLSLSLVNYKQNANNIRLLHVIYQDSFRRPERQAEGK